MTEAGAGLTKRTEEDRGGGFMLEPHCVAPQTYRTATPRTTPAISLETGEALKHTD